MNSYANKTYIFLIFFKQLSMKEFCVTFIIILFSSCKQNISSYDYTLNKVGEEIAFALDEDTKSFSRATFLYTDKEGKELSF